MIFNFYSTSAHQNNSKTHCLVNILDNNNNIFWDMDNNKGQNSIRNETSLQNFQKWQGFETETLQNAFNEGSGLQITHLKTIQIKRKTTSIKPSPHSTSQTIPRCQHHLITTHQSFNDYEILDQPHVSLRSKNTSVRLTKFRDPK